MKTQAWTFIDKSTWGDGPWQNEADKEQFPDEATGLPCLMVRNRLGAWCGYVGVPEGHPLFGKGYDEAYDTVDIDVHGGLTFAAPCQEGDSEHGICHIPEPGEPDHIWWFGFDHAHGYDFIPGVHALLPTHLQGKLRDEVYRDEAYVREQVASLAGQLAVAGHVESVA